MPRHNTQTSLEIFLIRAQLAEIPLNKLLTDEQIALIPQFQKINLEKNLKSSDSILESMNAIAKKLEEGLKANNYHEKVIENFRRIGALAQKAVLDKISLIKPDLGVPVVISLINGLIKSLHERKAPLAPVTPATIHFLNSVHAKMEDVDRIQCLGMLDQKSAIEKLTKVSVKADMEPYYKDITQVTLMSEEIQLWFEMAMWVEAHFLFVHNKALLKGKERHGVLQLVKTDDKEIVAPVDDEDNKFYDGTGTLGLFRGTGLTKHFINTFFHAMAVLLELKIKKDYQLDFDIDDIYPTEMVKDKIPLIGVPLKSKEALPYEITSPVNGKKQVKITLVDNVSEEMIVYAMRFFGKAVDGHALMTVQGAHRNGSLLRYLDALHGRGEDLLVSMTNAVENCVLTGKEDAMILRYIPTMQSFLIENYSNQSRDGYISQFFPTPRFHAESVDNIFKSITKEQFSGQGEIVLAVLNEIGGLRKKLLDNHSSALKAKVDEMIVNLKGYLVDGLRAAEVSQHRPVDDLERTIIKVSSSSGWKQ